MQQLQNLPTINEIDEQLRILRDRKITRAREKYCYYMEFIYNGRWKKARHLELLCNLLESVETRRIKQVNNNDASQTWKINDCNREFSLMVYRQES